VTETSREPRLSGETKATDTVQSSTDGKCLSNLFVFGFIPAFAHR
jgi:hypothetical protein